MGVRQHFELKHNVSTNNQTNTNTTPNNYTLHYFNGRGRAEILRMMFALAGQKFIDKRIEFNEWDRIRNDMPCMRVPVLEMDGGIRMPETMAIARYLAREFNFYPKSNMDMMRCDYITDCFYEIMHDYMRYFHERNGRFRLRQNGEMMMSSNMSGNMMSDNMSSNMMSGNMMSGNMMSSKMMTGNMMSGNMSRDVMSNDNYMRWRYMNTFNRIMPFMERTLCMRNSGSKFFMGNDMMMCDMMMYCCMEMMMMENQSMMSRYSKLTSLYQRIAQHPKVSMYLKSRRQTTW